jgi:hypothetical protein
VAPFIVFALCTHIWYAIYDMYRNIENYTKHNPISKFNPHYKSRWTKHPCNSISTSWTSLQSWFIDGKHVEEFPNVFWGHLMNKNIPLRKEDEYYAYSSKSGRDLMLCGPDLTQLNHGRITIIQHFSISESSIHMWVFEWIPKSRQWTSGHFLASTGQSWEEHCTVM